MKSDVRLCTYGDHRYGMAWPYKKKNKIAFEKKQEYGVMCPKRMVWTEQKRQMIIDACNVNIWYGDAEGESLRKS